jgi:RNA polymerase sigma-70 factor (ECF subfamily)
MEETILLPAPPTPSEEQAEEPGLTPEKIYHEFAPRVFNIARKLLSNDCDAEDVTQEVLLQVLRKLSTFRGDSAFGTWLHRVTVNAALAHRRKRLAHAERFVPHPEDDLLEDGQRPSHARPWVARPEEEIVDRETHQLIARAIGRLPASYREVFVLAEVEGWANAEVAEQLGLSLSAMKSRLHRARGMLRESLAPHFEDLPA